MKKGIYEVFDVIFKNYITKKPVFVFDTLKVSTLNVTGEQASQTGGKGNAELYIADHSRKVTLEMTDALISMTSLAMLAGKDGPSKGQKTITGKMEFDFNNLVSANDGRVPSPAVVTVTSGVSSEGIIKLTTEGGKAAPININVDGTENSPSLLAKKIEEEINLSSAQKGYTYSAVADQAKVTISTGAQVETINLTLDASTTGAKFDNTSIKMTGGKSPSLPSGVIELPNTPVEGSVYIIDTNTEDVIALDSLEGASISGKTIKVKSPKTMKGVVIYNYTAKKTKYVTISSDTFPGYFEVEGNTLEVDSCSGEMKEFILRIPKAKLAPNFSIELNSEAKPAEFTFNLNAMKDCGHKDMVEFIEIESVE